MAVHSFPQIFGIQTFCGVCTRLFPSRRDTFGYVLAELDDAEDWVLYHSRKRIGRDDAARHAGASFGRWSTPDAPLTGRRRSDGSLRAVRTDRKVKLECPKGHRLSPVEADLSKMITDAVARRAPQIVIPEK